MLPRQAITRKPGARATSGASTSRSLISRRRSSAPSRPEKLGNTRKKLPLVKDPKTGNFFAIAKTQNGHFAKNLQFVAGPGSLLTRLTNPAMLANVGALMSQQAMQQAMDEIKDYLAKIDEKVDDVLRVQKDAVLADMIGVGLVIEEAMTIREHVDRVDEVTWSKVQATALAIARTQVLQLPFRGECSPALFSVTGVLQLAVM